MSARVRTGSAFASVLVGLDAHEIAVDVEPMPAGHGLRIEIPEGAASSVPARK